MRGDMAAREPFYAQASLVVDLTRCPTTSWSNISCKLSPTVADNRPIGIYDSLGGLTVWREVRRAPR